MVVKTDMTCLGLLRLLGCRRFLRLGCSLWFLGGSGLGFRRSCLELELLRLVGLGFLGGGRLCYLRLLGTGCFRLLCSGCLGDLFDRRLGLGGGLCLGWLRLLGSRGFFRCRQLLLRSCLLLGLFLADAEAAGRSSSLGLLQRIVFHSAAQRNLQVLVDDCLVGADLVVLDDVLEDRLSRRTSSFLQLRQRLLHHFTVFRVVA